MRCNRTLVHENRHVVLAQARRAGRIVAPRVSVGKPERGSIKPALAGERKPVILRARVAVVCFKYVMPASPNIRIRPIEKTDFERLYAIDQACFPLGVAYSRYEMRWFITRKGAFGFVAEAAPVDANAASGESIIGFILGWKERNRAGHIITLDVLEPYRRRAVGALLMKKAEEEFVSSRIRLAVLEVAVSNEAALSFYKKFGYEVSERLGSYYPTGEDAFEMIRWLESEASST